MLVPLLYFGFQNECPVLLWRRALLDFLQRRPHLGWAHGSPLLTSLMVTAKPCGVFKPLAWVMRLYLSGLFVTVMLFLVKCLNVLALLFIPALGPRENESSCLPFYVKHPRPPHTSSSNIWLWFPLVFATASDQTVPDLVKLFWVKGINLLIISWKALVFPGAVTETCWIPP